jgi:ABC-type sugar transport system substrate-binding protein/DNA-binding CsgD family transcriptional regulator
VAIVTIRKKGFYRFRHIIGRKRSHYVRVLVKSAYVMTTKQHPDLLGVLTKRELEILALIQEGLSNAEIAARLVLTHATVKWYLQQIYSKLGVGSRTRALARARDLGLFADQPLTPAATASSPVPPLNPFKGLHAFSEDDVDDFFGREDFVQRLLARLNDNRPLSRFLAIVGPSGSGKSSLLGAGLVAALRQGALLGSERWTILTVVPGTHPLQALEIGLRRLASGREANLIDSLRRDERGLLSAGSIVVPELDRELLLIVDQFEEIFALVEDQEERRRFLQLIHTAITDPKSQVRVVIALRADFYDRPLLYSAFGELMGNRTEVVLPMTAEELDQAITRPAKRVGVTLEAGLVATVVADVIDQPGTLPLLQYALTELFDRLEGSELTLATYHSIGGVPGALGRRADALFDALKPIEQNLTEQVFLRLVTLGEGSEDTRRRAPMAELLSLGDPQVIDAILQTFTAFRLLTLDRDLISQIPTVELAHEALIHEWARLSAWLNHSRADVRMQRALAHAAVEWEAARQDSSFLLIGSRLLQFEGWAASVTVALTPDERDFLSASLAERERKAGIEQGRQARETRLERRSRTILRALVVVLLLASLGGFGLAGVAINQSTIAERNEAEARALYLASAAQLALSEGNLDEAKALAEASRQSVPNPPALAQQVLAEASYAPGTQRIFAADANVDPAVLAPEETPLEFVIVSHFGPRVQFGAVVSKGVEDACAALNVSCQWLSAEEFDLDLTNYWEAALALNPDGIGTTFIDPETIRLAVQQATGRGIPVVVFNVSETSDAENALPGLLYIGSNVFGAGQSNARRVLTEAAADGVTIHRGICTNQGPGLTWITAYCTGVKSVFEEAGVPLEELVVTDNPEVAAREFADFFGANPDVNAVLIAGPGTTWGLNDYMRRHSRHPGELYVATRDTHPELLEMIRNGYLLQTIDQQLYVQGYQTIVSLYLYRQYGLRPSGYINTSSVVDANNVDVVSRLMDAGYR